MTDGHEEENINVVGAEEVENFVHDGTEEEEESDFMRMDGAEEDCRANVPDYEIMRRLAMNQRDNCPLIPPAYRDKRAKNATLILCGLLLYSSRFDSNQVAVAGLLGRERSSYSKPNV